MGLYAYVPSRRSSFPTGPLTRFCVNQLSHGKGRVALSLFPHLLIIARVAALLLQTCFPSIARADHDELSRDDIAPFVAVGAALSIGGLGASLHANKNGRPGPFQTWFVAWGTTFVVTTVAVKTDNENFATSAAVGAVVAFPVAGLASLFHYFLVPKKSKAEAIFNLDRGGKAAIGFPLLRYETKAPGRQLRMDPRWSLRLLSVDL